MKHVYFDNNATTQTAREVVDAMIPYHLEWYQNPSSASGEAVGLRRDVGGARRVLAELLGLADDDHLFFTSGATESNNWVFRAMEQLPSVPGHIIVSGIEHPSVLVPAQRLGSLGWEITVLPVAATGIVDLEALESAIRPSTAMVSIMAANNETGVIQPVAALAAVVKSRAPGSLFHTDATQAVGKIRVALDSDWCDVDLLSLSAHKFHGPKGCGAIVVRNGLTLSPLMLGGGQEEGQRSGTLNVPGIVGTGAAATLVRDMQAVCRNIGSLRDTFEARLRGVFPDVMIHGENSSRLPNTSCFSLPGCHADSLADDLAARGVFVGTGAACSSGSLRPANTLLQMGVAYDLAAAGIRVSLSRYSTMDEIELLLENMEQVRRLSPH